MTGPLLLFVVATLIEHPVESLAGPGVIALGLPACAFWKRKPAAPA